jgi:hypothetical protein
MVSKLGFTYTSGSATSLAIDPVTTNVLCTIAADGLEVTTDGGVTWNAPTISETCGFSECRHAELTKSPVDLIYLDDSEAHS